MPRRSRSPAYELERLQRKMRKLEKKIDRRTRGHSNGRSRERSRSRGHSNGRSRERSRSPLRETSKDLSTMNLTPPTQPTVGEPQSETQDANRGDPELQQNENQVEDELKLDEETLAIIGEDLCLIENYGKDINKDIAVRLQHITINGLTKEKFKELLDKYLVPKNCPLIEAPKLNPEVSAALTEPLIKRDKNLEYKQKIMSHAISCLGDAITMSLSATDKNPKLLELLMDSARLLCEVQHRDSLTRRSFVLSTLKKDMKDQIQTTKIEKKLFGQNLQETIKTAKAIHKTSSDLRPTATKTAPEKNISSKNVRFIPQQRRAPMGNQMNNKESRSTKYQPTNSAKTSRHQQSRYRH